MPCDICNHTLQNMGVEGQRIFWCPRCGSVKTENGDFHETSQPMLVSRARKAYDGSLKTSSYNWATVDIKDWREILDAIGWLHKIQ